MEKEILAYSILFLVMSLPLVFAALVRVGYDLIDSYKSLESKKVFIKVDR